MPTDRVKAAVEELHAALVDEGMDSGTVEAQLKYILPPEETVVGNYADLQRMGAAVVKGVIPTPPGQDDIKSSKLEDAFTVDTPLDAQTEAQKANVAPTKTHPAPAKAHPAAKKEG